MGVSMLGALGLIRPHARIHWCVCVLAATGVALYVPATWALIAYEMHTEAAGGPGTSTDGCRTVHGRVWRSRRGRPSPRSCSARPRAACCWRVRWPCAPTCGPADDVCVMASPRRSPGWGTGWAGCRVDDRLGGSAMAVDTLRIAGLVLAATGAFLHRRPSARSSTPCALPAQSWHLVPTCPRCFAAATHGRAASVPSWAGR